MFLVFREVWDLFRDRKRQALLVWIVILLGAGTLYYARVEQWSYTDSFYFSVITLVTVGYGDLSPTTTGSKMFTVFYLMFGLSIILAFINTLAKDRVRLVEQRINPEEDWDIG